MFDPPLETPRVAPAHPSPTAQTSRAAGWPSSRCCSAVTEGVFAASAIQRSSGAMNHGVNHPILHGGVRTHQPRRTDIAIAGSASRAMPTNPISVAKLEKHWVNQMSFRNPYNFKGTPHVVLFCGTGGWRDVESGPNWGQSGRDGGEFGRRCPTCGGDMRPEPGGTRGTSEQNT